MLFAHLSDPHLTVPGARPAAWTGKRVLGQLSWRTNRRREHRQDVLEALLADLAEQAPERLVVSGDLTQVGLPEEVAQARAWLERLGNPESVLVVPGNHDAYVRGALDSALTQWAPWMHSDGAAADAPPVFPTIRRWPEGGAVFIGLSTACPTPFFRATGRIGAEQLERLDALLTDTPQDDTLRVVVLHHPPEPGATRSRKRLIDGAPLCEMLTRHGVDLVLHGHEHRQSVRSLEGPRGPMWILGVASASARGRHGPEKLGGYNLIDVTSVDGRPRIEVRTRQWDDASGRFVDGGHTRLGAR